MFWQNKNWLFRPTISYSTFAARIFCANFWEARAGRDFLPRRVAKRLLLGVFLTPLFLPAPPERSVLVFVKKG
jgi:hypothetical protein